MISPLLWCYPWKSSLLIVEIKLYQTLSHFLRLSSKKHAMHQNLFWLKIIRFETSLFKKLGAYSVFFNLVALLVMEMLSVLLYLGLFSPYYCQDASSVSCHSTEFNWIFNTRINSHCVMPSTCNARTAFCWEAIRQCWNKLY